MTAPIHYEVEILDGTLFAPLCENNAGVDAFDASDDVEMTDRDEEVTCPACLAALGYAVPVEQLTECRGDPLSRAA